MTVRFFYPVSSYSLYIIRCNSKPLLVLLVCLCKIFQRTLSLCMLREAISQKRVQKYELFSKLPNVLRKNFHFSLNFNIQKHFKSIFANRLIIIYIRTSGVCAGAQVRKRMGASIHASVYLRPRNSIIVLYPKPYNYCFNCFKRWNNMSP